MKRLLPHLESDYVCGGLILLLTLALRLAYLGQVEHNIDHAYPIWQALTTLEEGRFPVVGQATSVLFANPALTGYLYLPVVALFRSPVAVYLLVISLNSLGVMLAGQAMRGMLGPKVALVGAFLLAVNPWVIEYSRATWVQSLLPFFTGALAWALWPVLRGTAQHPQRRTLLSLGLLTLMTQTYLLAYLMVAPVGVLLLIFWRRMPKRALMGGITLLVLAGLIYVAGLLAEPNMLRENLNNFGQSAAQLSTEAWNHAVRLITGADYPLARGQNAPIADSILRQQVTQIAHYVLLVLLLIGMARGLSALRRASPQREVAIILLVWFLLPIALMSYVGKPVHPFYQLLGLPAGVAFVGWAVDLLPAFRYRTATLITALCGFGLLMSLNSIRYAQETAAAPGTHDLGALSLEYGLQLGALIREQLPPEGMVYAEVDAWTLNSFAGALFPVQRDTRSPQVTLIPAQGGLYVVAHHTAPQPWSPPPLTSQHFSIPLPGDGLITVDAYTPNIQQSLTLLPTPITSEENLTLLSYSLNENPPQLITLWRVDALTPETTQWVFAPFAQAFDAAGQQLGVIEGQSVSGPAWRTGDLHRYEMPLPAGTVSVQLGQFDPVRQHNMIFLPDYTPLIPLP